MSRGGSFGNEEIGRLKFVGGVCRILGSAHLRYLLTVVLSCERQALYKLCLLSGLHQAALPQFSSQLHNRELVPVGRHVADLVTQARMDTLKQMTAK
jgi:hypothetical protein